MTGTPPGAHVFAVLTDGTQVEIKRLNTADRDEVRTLHRDLSEESLRVFGLNRTVADQLAALGVWLHGDLIGLAEYEPTKAPGEAEAAMAVPDLRQPRVIAVVGASCGPGTVGAEIVRTIMSGGFKGAAYAVNPHSAGADLHGVPCVASLADLPEPPDLAIITVPAESVPSVAAACGRFGTSTLVVISPDLTPAQARDLRTICREHGMRLLIPSSSGSTRRC